MAQALDIPMPPNLDIGPSYTLRVTALDPTTGALVSGVTVNTVVLSVSLLEGTGDGLETGSWFLVPGAGA